MYMPPDVLSCIHALEDASYPTYAVGGCVRDHLLGLTPQDFDLCTAATPEQMQAVFSQNKLVLAGIKHGTVGVVCPSGVVEITTFRTEGTYADNRHPDWVEFVTDIESDLSRRDFTVNAMAWSPTRGLCDPFCGQTDLQNCILRAVGDPDKRFQEDALRILRGVRFAARFRLQIEENTAQAMLRQRHLMDNLARERIFDELCKLLLSADTQILLTAAPILTQVIPELAPTLNFDQHSPHHAFDLYTHIAHVTANVPPELPLRWAALLHDIGKIPTFSQDDGGRGHFYGHAKESAAMADAILHRLKAPTALRENVVALIGQHMTKLEPEKKFLRRRLSALGSPLLQQVIALQQADMGSKGVKNGMDDGYFAPIQSILNEILAEDACFAIRDLAVDGNDLMALGLSGKQIGSCLQWLLEQVLDEILPNDPTALLAAAQRYIPEDTK